MTDIFEFVFESLNIGIYKLEDNNTQNNFVLHDKNINVFHIELSLVTLYDIIKDRYLDLIYMLYVGGKTQKEDWRKLYDDSKIISKSDKKKSLISDQKFIFMMFKDMVLLYKINIMGFDCIPENKRIYEISGRKKLNIYIGKHDISNIEVRNTKDFPNIEFLMKNLLQEGYDFFLKMLAWKIQYPTQVISNHWVIQDKGGTGKTEILANDILMRIFNVAIIGQDELTSPYTEYLRNQQIIIAEEIEGYENEKKIKMLTNAQKLRVREIYKGGYEVMNIATWILFSNDIKPLKLSRNDRRFNVVGGGLRLSPGTDGDWSKTLFKSKKANESFFENYHQNIDSEIRNMIAYLKGLKVTRTEIQQTLNTKFKQQLEEINYSSDEMFISEIKDIGFEGVVEEYWGKNKGDFYKDYIIDRSNDNDINQGTWIKSGGLYSLYVEYSRLSGLRPCGKTYFFRKIKSIDWYDNIFGESLIISTDSHKHRVIKIKNKIFDSNSPLDNIPDDDLI